MLQQADGKPQFNHARVSVETIMYMLMLIRRYAIGPATNGAESGLFRYPLIPYFKIIRAQLGEML